MLGGEFFVESEERLVMAGFGVVGEATIVEGNFWMGEIEGKDGFCESEVEAQAVGIVGQKEVEFVDDEGAAHAIDDFHDIDCFADGDIGNVMRRAGGVEEFDGLLALGRATADGAA